MISAGWEDSERRSRFHDYDHQLVIVLGLPTGGQWRASCFLHNLSLYACVDLGLDREAAKRQAVQLAREHLQALIDALPRE